MVESAFFVSLADIIERFELKKIHMEENSAQALIGNCEVNRPGLPMIGYYDHFESERIQIMGRVEYSYLEQLQTDERRQKLEALFATGIPALIITRGMEPFPEMEQLSKQYKVPVLQTDFATSSFMSALIAYLNTQLAERVTRHGVLVEVYGEGVLILGESGVGKSETAIELVKRGHRLVADDAVEIKKVSAISLVGSAPEIIRHFIEIRGIGIIDVKRIFGMGAVKDSEKINMIINLEAWVDGKHYDRLGLSDEYTEIMGIAVPSLLIPVKPGRNLAIIVEIAAMNNRQKRMGYNAAEALNNRLVEEMEKNAME